MADKFDVTAARKQFPALDKKQVYFDNAGGSQVLGSVVETYVALGQSDNLILCPLLTLS